MYQKTVEKEAYSKADLAKIKRVLKKGNDAFRKDPEFRKALNAFIRETT